MCADFFFFIQRGQETGARSKRLPPPREGGGHCLAIRREKIFREGEREWQKEWEKFSTKDSAQERWRGEISSVLWSCAQSCRPELLETALYPTVAPSHCRPVQLASGSSAFFFFFFLIRDRTTRRQDRRREKCVALANTEQCQSARSLHHLFIGVGERERHRGSEREKGEQERGERAKEGVGVARLLLPVLCCEASVADWLALPSPCCFPILSVSSLSLSRCAASTLAVKMHRRRPARGLTLLLPVALWIFSLGSGGHGALPTTRKLFVFILWMFLSELCGWLWIWVGACLRQRTVRVPVG